MDPARILRTLIAAEIAFVLLGIGAGLWLGDSLPVQLREYLRSRSKEPLTSLDLAQASPLVLLAAGWIGLWNLKRWSRAVYTIASALFVLAGLSMGPAAMHAVEFALGEAGTLASGGILSLIWLSPLSERFRAGPSDSSPH